MIGRIKAGWRTFAGYQPGRRFRERYRLRRRRRPGGFGLASLPHLLGGAGLVVLSALFGWLPVLGWGTAVLGLGMIAGEFYPAARAMDRLEVWARRVLWPLGGRFAGLPAWARLAVSVMLAAAAFALVYGSYSLVLAR